MCTAKRHAKGSWYDKILHVAVVRTTEGGLVVELVEQTRPLFEVPDDRKDPSACCRETRTIARVVGDVTSTETAAAVRNAVRKFEPQLIGVRRKSNRTEQRR